MPPVGSEPEGSKNRSGRPMDWSKYCPCLMMEKRNSDMSEDTNQSCALKCCLVLAAG